MQDMQGDPTLRKSQMLQEMQHLELQLKAVREPNGKKNKPKE